MYKIWWYSRVNYTSVVIFVLLPAMLEIKSCDGMVRNGKVLAMVYAVHLILQNA